MEQYVSAIRFLNCLDGVKGLQRICRKIAEDPICAHCALVTTGMRCVLHEHGYLSTSLMLTVTLVTTFRDASKRKHEEDAQRLLRIRKRWR